MPLRALFDGKDFYSEDLSESHRKNIFLCPICKMRFVIVLPRENRIKHFRHPKGGFSHYEPETEEHLNGKKVLMEIATKLGLKAQTEVMIGNHVTDVLIDGDQPLAIEFQCSKCNSKEISDRTETYKKNGKATLWILGTNFTQKLQYGAQTFIEREIETIHPTIYFTKEKFIICRRNPKYYGYYDSYSREEKSRIVEEFDIEWHLEKFVATKLTSDNPSLVFQFEIEAERLEKEQETARLQEIEYWREQTEKMKNALKQVKTGYPDDSLPPNYPLFRARYRPPNYQPPPTHQPPPTKVIHIDPKVPTWLVRKIISSESCDYCGKNKNAYVANLEGTNTSIKRCEDCLNKLKITFSSAIWKTVAKKD